MPDPTPKYDSAEMARRGRRGAWTTHSLHDPHDTTRKGRQAALRRFEEQVDPDRVLPEAERNRRVEYAKSLYFSRLAYRSHEKRRANRDGGKSA